MDALKSALLWQLPIVDPLPYEFVEGFVHNFLLACGYFVISLAIGPLIWGSLDKEKRVLWHTSFVAGVQPLYVGDVRRCFFFTVKSTRDCLLLYLISLSQRPDLLLTQSGRRLYLTLVLVPRTLILRGEFLPKTPFSVLPGGLLRVARNCPTGYMVVQQSVGRRGRNRLVARPTHQGLVLRYRVELRFHVF